MKCCKHCGMGAAVAVSAAVSAVTAAATVMLLALCKHSGGCEPLCECLSDMPCPDPANEE